MNTTDLVPVFTGELNGQPAQLVNARDLHQFLESDRQFADWIKDRVEQYGFEEGKDFFTVLRKSRGRPRTEYHVTLDTAKELAMVERNDKGRQARRYFIECERKAHQQTLPPPADTLPETIRLAIARKAHALAMQGFEQIRTQLEQRVREQLPHRRPQELLQWLDDIGGPDAELVVLNAHQLRSVTSMVAVADLSIHNTLAAIHTLEESTGRPWYDRLHKA